MVQSKINNILKELTKAIISEVRIEVKKEIRTYYFEEISKTIKDILEQDRLIRNNDRSFLSMEEIRLKYKLSKATICKKCKKHKVERLNSGKYKLINELQFIEALKQKEEIPTFINKNRVCN